MDPVAAAAEEGILCEDTVKGEVMDRLQVLVEELFQEDQWDFHQTGLRSPLDMATVMRNKDVGPTM